LRPYKPLPGEIMAEAVTVTPAERRTLAKVRRLLLTYIIVGQFLVQLDRTNIGFAQLTMRHDLAIGATAFGFASGIYALAAFFVQAPAAVMLERIGSRRWLTLIMIGWGLVVMAHGLVTSPAQLVVLRFVLGALESGYTPAAYIIISLWFRGENHGKSVSAVQIGTALSGILGAPFAGWVLSHALLGLAGWRTLFVIEGGLTVLWALVSLRIIYDGPLQTRWLRDDERRFMDRYLAAYQQEKAASGAVERAGFLDTVRDWRIMLLLVAYACAGWVSATFAFFIPSLLEQAGRGLGPQAVGFLAVGPYVVMGLVAVTWGAHADRTERHWHCVLPLLVGALGVILYPYAKSAGSAVMAMVCLALVQAGSSGFFVAFWATCNMVAGRGTIAKSTALITSATHATSFAAPLFFGWAQDHTGGTRFGLYVAMGVMLLNFVVMNLFFVRWKMQQAQVAPVVAR
jgi:MFS transporter, ACS family, tartrate transporter